MEKVASSPRKVKTDRKQNRNKQSTKSNSYRLRNWAEYDRALKQRGSLTFWFSEEAIGQWSYTGPPQRGAQFRYSDLAIETSLTLRVLFKQPLRQTEGLVNSLMELMGLNLPVPDHTTLSRRQATVQIPSFAQDTTEPVHVVVDSTGLKVYGEGEWKVRQHGYSKRRTWRKLHLAVDEANGDILVNTLTLNSVDDASQVEPMLKEIARPILALGGDGAYDKEKVYQALAHPPHQSEPILAIIPPQKNARIKQHGNCAKNPLPRDENLRAIRKQGRSQWKAESGYHRRSIAETQMARYKRIIGPCLHSRRLERQERESQIGCKILNQMRQLGMPASYKVEVTA